MEVTKAGSDSWGFQEEPSKQKVKPRFRKAKAEAESEIALGAQAGQKREKQTAGGQRIFKKAVSDIASDARQAAKTAVKAADRAREAGELAERAAKRAEHDVELIQTALTRLSLTDSPLPLSEGEASPPTPPFGEPFAEIVEAPPPPLIKSLSAARAQRLTPPPLSPSLLDDELVEIIPMPIQTPRHKEMAVFHPVPQGVGEAEGPADFLPEAEGQIGQLEKQAGFKTALSAIDKSLAMYSRMAAALHKMDPSLKKQNQEIQKVIEEHETRENERKKRDLDQAMSTALKFTDDRALQSAIVSFRSEKALDVHGQLKAFFSEVSKNPLLPETQRNAIERFSRSSPYAKNLDTLKNELLQIDFHFLRQPFQKLNQSGLKETLKASALLFIPTARRTERVALLLDKVMESVLDELTRRPGRYIDYEGEGLNEEKLLLLINQQVAVAFDARISPQIVSSICSGAVQILKKEFEDTLLPLAHASQHEPAIERDLIKLNVEITEKLCAMAESVKDESAKDILRTVKQYQEAIHAVIEGVKKPLSPLEIALKQLHEFGFRDLSKLKRQEVLGKGLFAKVYQVVNDKDEPSVVKVLEKPISKLEWRKQVPSGEQLALYSDSQYVVKPTHFIYDAQDNIVGLVFPLIQKPTELKKAMEQNMLNEAMKIKVLNQLLHGLLSLHRKGIGHLDLHADNVLLDKDGNVRIIDFGTSLRCDPETREALEPPVGRAITSMHDDCHRFAKHLYRMYEGEYPAGIPVFRNIRDVRLQGLIRRSVSLDPSQRPSLEEFLACDLFAA